VSTPRNTTVPGSEYSVLLRVGARLEILPGAAVFLGGFLLLIARTRHTALFGALLAATAGARFTLGTTLSPLWNGPMRSAPSD